MPARALAHAPAAPQRRAGQVVLHPRINRYHSRDRRQIRPDARTFGLPASCVCPSCLRLRRSPSLCSCALSAPGVEGGGCGAAGRHPRPGRPAPPSTPTEPAPPSTTRPSPSSQIRSRRFFAHQPFRTQGKLYGAGGSRSARRALARLHSHGGPQLRSGQAPPRAALARLECRQAWCLPACWSRASWPSRAPP